MITFEISEEFIKLGQVLKLSGIADSGVDAKNIILDGKVLVNNQIEIRRGRKIRNGDIIQVEGEEKIIIKNKEDNL